MNERRLDDWITWVLAAGVIASGALIAAGLLASAAVGWTGSLTGATIATSDPTDFGDLLPRLVALQPLALSQAGLVLLILTPVVRVAITVLGFIQEHDRLYAALSALVLLMLLIGFAIGAVAGVGAAP